MSSLSPFPSSTSFFAEFNDGRGALPEEFQGSGQSHILGCKSLIGSSTAWEAEVVQRQSRPYISLWMRFKSITAHEILACLCGIEPGNLGTKNL